MPRPATSTTKTGQQVAQTSSRSNSNGNGSYWGARDQSNKCKGQSQSRDWRGRRGGRGGHNRNLDRQSESEKQVAKPCCRCNKMLHNQSDCWAKEAECFNCDKKGHIAPACRAPKRETQTKGDVDTLSGCYPALRWHMLQARQRRQPAPTTYM